ncbi:Uncharacterised protein [Mycobacteroides abscessus subsp. abscessus]|nr:Uncharacterised protein [Mycobacteroides abscessus subsp. abscessus]
MRSATLTTVASMSSMNDAASKQISAIVRALPAIPGVEPEGVASGDDSGERRVVTRERSTTLSSADSSGAVVIRCSWVAG